MSVFRIPAYRYEDCTVVRWVDGDTLVMKARAHFDMGFKMVITGQFEGHFRLSGIDAWERRDPLGPAATAYVNRTMPAGTTVCAETFKDPDSFGRYLAKVWLPGYEDLSINAQLVTAHLAWEAF